MKKVYQYYDNVVNDWLCSFTKSDKYKFVKFQYTSTNKKILLCMYINNQFPSY